MPDKPHKIEVSPDDFQMLQKIKEMGTSGDLLNMTSMIGQQMELAVDTYVAQQNTLLVTHRIMVMLENIYNTVNGSKPPFSKKVKLPQLPILQLVVKDTKKAQ